MVKVSRRWVCDTAEITELAVGEVSDMHKV